MTRTVFARSWLTHAEAVIAELRSVVAELRKQIESQQAHIHRLVKITFGRGGERVEGPTLFDGMAVPDAEVPTPVEPPTPEAPPAMKRKGHGRRCKPKDLPRRREEIDLSDAEKVCACCGTLKVRIGQSTSERLDYQPMAIFVRELVRPTYACRSCESQGHDPQIARAVLPPEPIPKSGIGGRPARPRHRLEDASITCRCTARSRSWPATAGTCGVRPSATTCRSAANC